MDKTGKIVISPEYYDAYPFAEGLALVQPFRVLDGRAIRVQIIDKSGKIVFSQLYELGEAPDGSDVMEALQRLAQKESQPAAK